MFCYLIFSQTRSIQSPGSFSFFSIRKGHLIMKSKFKWVLNSTLLYYRHTGYFDLRVWFKTWQRTFLSSQVTTTLRASIVFRSFSSKIWILPVSLICTKLYILIAVKVSVTISIRYFKEVLAEVKILQKSFQLKIKLAPIKILCHFSIWIPIVLVDMIIF